MPDSSVPELQEKLFKRLGIEGSGPGQRAPAQKFSSRNSRGGGQAQSRKEQRKAQRAQKRSHTYSKNSPPPTQNRVTKPKNASSVKNASNWQKSILKKPPPSQTQESNLDDEDNLEDEPLSGDASESGDDLSEGFSIEDGVDEDMGGDDCGTSKSKAQSNSSGTKVSRAMRDRLAQDDAEIDEFERKLGIKKGRKSLPQSFKDDGLDLLMNDLGGDEEESSDDESRKRKRDYDDWLSSKRRNTGDHRSTPAAVLGNGGEEEEDVTDDFDEGDDAESDDELDLDEDDDLGLEDDDEDDESQDGTSFEGFDSDIEEEPTRPRQRENPYVAPTTGSVVAKYIPPSLRKATGGEGEALSRLRKQVQGLINRLTDANILSIVQSVEDLYQKNPRGDVTEALTDTILAQVRKPESLPDQFFVLTGGFAAAVYKIIGSSFGSHLVRRVVQDLGQEYDKVRAYQVEESAIPKEASNFITLLSQLYVFEVVSCKIIFDYMERLLEDLNEVNVELLLRICRNGGRLLRRDDPQALKHVSAILSKAVSKAGYANVSARTKFMIETIEDLRNKKPKGKGMNSAVVSESVVKMKKRLGELKSQSRRLDGLAPMGMGLEDVVSADTRGKWWLVGASVPAKPEKAVGGVEGTSEARKHNINADSDSEDMDFVLPDYPKKARGQGLTTPTQIAIFTALLTALDYQQGYRQFLNLKLKKDDQLEIARVLVQCVGSENDYNPYYALVGERACTNGKIRFALQDRLWKVFRAMGESLFGEEPDDRETADSLRFQEEQRVRNVAHFYASLMVAGALRVSILKPLNLAEASQQTSEFLEWLCICLLQECRSKKAEKEDTKVMEVFGLARDLPELSAGLNWFLRKRVRKTKLISSKEAKKLERVREKAQLAVQGRHEVEDEQGDLVMG